MKAMRRRRILSGLGIILLLFVLGYGILRSFHLRWGASGDDLSRNMPGDLEGRNWTRAVTIEASPEDIWPWLVQWGQGRGGWYSYDWLENLLGFDIHSADRILPEYQDPQIGDPICMTANACTSFVSVVEPYQWFGWQATEEGGKPVWNYVFGLFPVDDTHTRLVVRESFDPTAMPSFVTFLIEIPDVVMELKALDTVKVRAEGKARSNLVMIYEIAVWLAALVIGVISGFQYVKREAWRISLAIGVAALSVLQVFTFLFPPLWLRAVLVILLTVGLIWSLRRPASR